MAARLFLSSCTSLTMYTTMLLKVSFLFVCMIIGSGGNIGLLLVKDALDRTLRCRYVSIASVHQHFLFVLEGPPWVPSPVIPCMCAMKHAVLNTNLPLRFLPYTIPVSI